MGLGTLAEQETDCNLLRRFLQLVFALPTSNAAVERGFSQTKMFLEARESLSLQSLFGQRITKEAILYYGGSDKVPITPALLIKQNMARQAYSVRLESERREKAAKEIERQAEKEASRKRAIEEAERADFASKKKKLEEEEKTLANQIKYDESVLEGIQDKAGKSINLSEVKSAMSTAKVLRESIKRKRSELASVTAKKVKLLERKAAK